MYFLRHKDEVLQHFKEYATWLERQTGQKISTLRSDNGTEYVNNDFDAYLKQHGIQRQLATVYTPEQNGVSERFNRTVVESARTMLQFATLPQCYWAKAGANAAVVRNCCLKKAVDGQAPFEEFFGRKPNVGKFRIFES